MLKNFTIFLIKIYQNLSKYTPRICRFYPTCSEYTKQAIIKYGFLKGCYLGILRITKCHPLNSGGVDLVP
ncbi:MAG: membrane protein insertion efficiency factor YidD [bacterium]